MAGTSRTRSRYKDSVSGSYSYRGTTISDKDTPNTYEYCEDYIEDYGGDHPFRKENRDRVSHTLSGSLGNYQFNNWHTTLATVHPDNHGLSVTQLATEAMARTNPSRPHVQLPVFWSELRDVPRLIRIGGRNQIERLASINIQSKFGWNPFVSDLLKLTFFNDTLTKRINELDRLMSGNGLQRRVSLYSSSNSVTGSEQTIMSSPSNTLTKGIPTTVNTVEAWATLKWKPSITTLLSTDIERSRRLRRTLLGLHSSQILSNVWEGLPWSWLADWIGNVGTWIQARNNSIAHLAGSVNVMIHSKAERTYQVTSKPSWASLSPEQPKLTGEVKERFLGQPGLSASIPLLSAGQLSILGSLYVLRGRKR